MLKPMICIYLYQVCIVYAFINNFNLLNLGYPVCRHAYMLYHGISHYQFYTALKHVQDGSPLSQEHGNQEIEHSCFKQEMCHAFLSRICSELAEGLPTGFKLELSKRVF
jgi:hypothetical protein